MLLVEDNPEDAELVLRILRSCSLGEHVHVVRDGNAALDFMFARGPYAAGRLEDRPKLLLLDLKLPKVDGLEVLRALKADERTKRTPVVMLTSSREHPDLQEAYRLGVNSYVVKPVNFEAFGRAVSDIGKYWLLLNQSPKH